MLVWILQVAKEEEGVGFWEGGVTFYWQQDSAFQILKTTGEHLYFLLFF